MTAVCTTPATVLAVSIEDARKKVRMDDDALDDQLKLSLEGFIAAVEHTTGHCLMEQGWRVTLDAFPRTWCGNEAIVRLPHPALAVQSVTYIDTKGAAQTMPEAEYELVVERYRSFIAPRSGSWPGTAAKRRTVNIACTAGYGADPAKTPAGARQYILARLELEYCAPMPAPTLEQLEGLLGSLKVYG
jgi:uncharacterized phiE125 gp8 family phage protein